MSSKYGSRNSKRKLTSGMNVEFPGLFIEAGEGPFISAACTLPLLNPLLARVTGGVSRFAEEVGDASDAPRPK